LSKSLLQEQDNTIGYAVGEMQVFCVRREARQL